jgi:tRNA-modifying protein YgfZ
MSGAVEPFWSEYERDVVEVVGQDARSYLHSQLSIDIAALGSGDSRWAFALEPTGKVVVLVRVACHDDTRFVLDTDAGFGEALIARLNRFRIRVKAEISVLDWRCIAVRGDPLDRLAGGPVGGLASWGDGVDLLGPSVLPPEGVPHGDLEQARIAAGWPRMGAEIVPGVTIPAETGITDEAVSFTKGCYPGQELVERMDSRGANAPRQLQRVTVPDGTSPGTAIVVDGHQATVTSVAGTAALALVSRRPA